MSSTLQQPLSDPGADTTRQGRIERDVMLIEYRVGELERHHGTVPTLEQQFEHMSGQLSQLNEGQQKLTVVVSDIGKKITWALAIASTLWAILQMVGPALLRVILP